MTTRCLGLLLGLTLPLGAACDSAPSEPGPPALVRVDGACAGAHTIDAEGNPSGPARPIGDLARYRVPLYITEPWVRARADASWPAEDHRSGDDPRGNVGAHRAHLWPTLFSVRLPRRVR